MSKKAQSKPQLTGNLDPTHKINNELELGYYHVRLTSARTNEYGVPLEQPRTNILTPEEYANDAKANFYGYNAKVLHDPTLNKAAENTNATDNE